MRKKLGEKKRKTLEEIYGTKRAKEIRRNISAGRTGEKNHMYGRKGKNHPRFGKPHTKETRVKMSKSYKAHHKARLERGEDHPGKGRPSEKKGKDYIEMFGKEKARGIKNKIREKLLNGTLTEECKRKIRENAKSNPNYGMKGKKHTSEAKEKMSKFRKGKPNKFKGISFEEKYGEKRARDIKKKLSDANSGENSHMWGKHHSEEAKKKLSEAKKREKNPLWLGGQFPWYYGSNWSQQRRIISKRAKGFCENCKSKLGRFGTHHKIPFRVFIVKYVNENKKRVRGLTYADIADTVSIKANKVSNLICLCPLCHGKFEMKARKQYSEFIELKDSIKFLEAHGVIINPISSSFSSSSRSYSTGQSTQGAAQARVSDRQHHRRPHRFLRHLFRQ